MRILITGADQPLGHLLVAALRGNYELRLTGDGPLAPAVFEGLDYSPADLREPEEAEPLTAGIDAIIHLDTCPRIEALDSAAEKELLDHASRGMFVLLHAALKSGVSRVVLASRLELMAAYPADCLVDETWRPRPAADAASLAPFLAESTLREFVRAESLVGICLRLGELGAPDGTSEADAVAGVLRSLTMDLSDRKYHWWLYHLCSTDRYPLGAAANPPFSFKRHGAG